MASLFGGVEEDTGFELFRITVLGSCCSGKTSLISSFINNFCPTVYAPTLPPNDENVDSLLFYKTMDLVQVTCPQNVWVKDKKEYERCESDLRKVNAKDMHFEEDKMCMVCAEEPLGTEDVVWGCERKSEKCGYMCSKCWVKQLEEQTFPVLVEVEDSIAMPNLDEGKFEEMFLNMERGKRGDPSASPGGVSNASGSPTPKGGLLGDSSQMQESDTGSPFIRMLNDFKDETSNDDESAPQKLLGKFPPPVVAAHNPLSKRRMGFFVVFDCQDATSRADAFKLLEKLLKKISDSKKAKDKPPLICLVASKVDMVSNKESEIIRSAAEHKLEELNRSRGDQPITFEMISATELRKVKAMFRRMLMSIKKSTNLWKTPKQANDGGWFNLSPTKGSPNKQADEESRSSSDDENAKQAEPKKNCPLQ